MREELAVAECGYPVVVKDNDGWDVVVAVRNAAFRAEYTKRRQAIANASSLRGGSDVAQRDAIRSRDAWLAKQKVEYAKLGLPLPSFAPTSTSDCTLGNGVTLQAKVLRVLQSRRLSSLTDIAAEAGCSTRSALRVVKRLRVLGVRIAFIQLEANGEALYLLLSDDGFKGWHRKRPTQSLILRHLRDGCVCADELGFKRGTLAQNILRLRKAGHRIEVVRGRDVVSYRLVQERT